ncbi:MAG: response regulator [Deltaproteobacteria bacterium]|nr:response regulator [Deltaproteobacteria bacterium]
MPKVVCIVDDQPGLRKMLCFALGIQGYEVLEVENGDDALAVISSRHVDMLITDWQMPNMDGLELVRCLRKMHDYVDLPVVIVSCWDDLEARTEARSLGVTSWLKKPFRIAELQIMVENALAAASPPSGQHMKSTGTGLR